MSAAGLLARPSDKGFSIRRAGSAIAHTLAETEPFPLGKRPGPIYDPLH